MAGPLARLLRAWPSDTPLRRFRAMLYGLAVSAMCGTCALSLAVVVAGPSDAAERDRSSSEAFADRAFADAASTTADWNIGGQLRLAGSGARARTLTAVAFDHTSAAAVPGKTMTQFIALGDLDGDGHPDLVEGNLGVDYVYSNDGAGRFTEIYSAPKPDDTRSIAIGDVNRDGSLDFVTVSWDGRAKLYLNEGMGRTYAVQPVTRVERGGAAVALADIDGDGFLDIVIGNVRNGDEYANGLVLNTADPVAPFGRDGSTFIALDASLVEAATAIEFADVDNDGDLDIVFVTDASIRLHLNVTGSGECESLTAGCFVHAQIDSSGSHAGALGDVDGDGLLDLVVVGAGTGDAGRIHFGQPNGRDVNPFTDEALTFAVTENGGAALDVALADMNNDGMLDVAVVISGDALPNRVYLNDGTPGAQRPSFAQFLEISPQSGGAQALAVSDVNGDGKLDLVLGGQATQWDASPAVTNVFLNTGIADGPPALQLRGHATSNEVGGGGDGALVESVRLTASTAFVGPQFHNDVEFWVSIDGGGHWATIASDGRPVEFASPGRDLRWRAFLHAASPFGAGALSIDELTLSPNSRPVASSDDYTVYKDGALETGPPGVLGNDTDAEHDELSAVLLDGVRNGTLTLHENGAFLYTPDAGFSGTDSFTYQASDGTRSIAATATIEVMDTEASAAVKDARASLSTLNAYTPPPGHVACDADDATSQSGDLKLSAGSFTAASVKGDNELREHVEPVQINLIGPPCIIVEQGNTFIDPGATAYTPVFGDLTDQIQVHNPVDSNVVGTYTVTYFVRDPDSFETLIHRTVFVRAAGGEQPAADSGGGGASGGFELLMLLSLVTAAARLRYRRATVWRNVG